MRDFRPPDQGGAGRRVIRTADAVEWGMSRSPAAPAIRLGIESVVPAGLIHPWSPYKEIRRTRDHSSGWSWRRRN
jgi:hypothetical protein